MPVLFPWRLLTINFWSFRLLYFVYLYTCCCHCFLFFFDVCSVWRMFYLQWFKTINMLDLCRLFFWMVDFDVTLVQVFSSLLLFVSFRINLIISSFSFDFILNFTFAVFKCSLSSFSFSVYLLSAFCFETNLSSTVILLSSQQLRYSLIHLFVCSHRLSSSGKCSRTFIMPPNASASSSLLVDNLSVLTDVSRNTAVGVDSNISHIFFSKIK